MKKSGKFKCQENKTDVTGEIVNSEGQLRGQSVELRSRRSTVRIRIWAIGLLTFFIVKLFSLRTPCSQLRSNAHTYLLTTSYQLYNFVKTN